LWDDLLLHELLGSVLNGEPVNSPQRNECPRHEGDVGTFGALESRRTYLGLHLRPLPKEIVIDARQLHRALFHRCGLRVFTSR